MRLLEGNLIGVTLASVAAVLILVSMLLGVIWSQPPTVPEMENVDDGDNVEFEIPELEDNEPLERYAVITARPVFNPDRQPYVPSDEEGEGEGEELEEEEVEAPDVVLAGVIITPSLRMVTLRQKEDSESLIALEGQPLEGDFGTWQVSNIESRSATLSSAQGEEVQLELQIHDMAIAVPKTEKKARDSGDDSENEENQQDSDRPLTRAEEIRQRIAERREELRRAAEAEESDDDKAAEPQDYSSAIQSMIRGKQPGNQDDEENDQ